MRFLTAAFLGLLATVTWADDAPWMQVGNAGNFTKNKQIRMASEDVRIRLTNDRMKVHVSFVFRNEGSATKVTMAFPDGILDFVKRKPKEPMAILWMKSTVDGKQTTVTRQALPKAPDYHYTHVWLKEVSFGANQTRVVTVDYEAKHGDRGDFVFDYYTLQTGALWKGTIGKAVVTVDWSAMRGFTPVHFAKASRPVYGGDKIAFKTPSFRVARFEYTNLKPDFDIEMSWAKGFWSFDVNGRKTSGWPSRESVLSTTPNGKDPQISLDFLSELFLDNPSQEEVDSFKVGKHSFRVKGNGLWIDGKKVVARRTDEKGWIYVGDVVKALKGTYRYDSKTDQASIRFK